MKTATSAIEIDLLGKSRSYFWLIFRTWWKIASCPLSVTAVAVNIIFAWILNPLLFSAYNYIIFMLCMTDWLRFWGRCCCFLILFEFLIQFEISMFFLCFCRNLNFVWRAGKFGHNCAIVSAGLHTLSSQMFAWVNRSTKKTTNPSNSDWLRQEFDRIQYHLVVFVVLMSAVQSLLSCSLCDIRSSKPHSFRSLLCTLLFQIEIAFSPLQADTPYSTCVSSSVYT